MKKIYIILVLLTITAVSCKKDFIDLKPEDSYTGETFFKTEDQFKQAVVAAYAPLRDVLLNDYFTSEMHSDNTIYQPYPSNRGTAYIYREQISDFTIHLPMTMQMQYGSIVIQVYRVLIL